MDIIRKPRAELWEEKRKGIEFEGHRSVKAVLTTHPAMVYENQDRGCLDCQDGKARNPDTRWYRMDSREQTIPKPASKKTTSKSASKAAKKPISRTARKQPASK